MADALSLAQMRIFVAVADAGSFSAAARRVRRTQSAISETIANLEAQLDVPLFDRSGRYPRLTAEGTVLLDDVRSIVARVDDLRARAKGIAGGLEPELTAVMDVFLPLQRVAEVAKEFREVFPVTPLRLYVEALGAAVQPVLEGKASFGFVGSLPTLPDGLTAERVTSVRCIMVAAANHPLAGYEGAIPRDALRKHVQLVLTDRSDLSAGREFGVMSASTWKLADLSAKHAFLLGGLGWGSMPLHAVRQDIDEGRLVELSIENMPAEGFLMPMSAVYRTAEPPGPAGRWMIDRLKQCPNGRAEP